MGYHKYLGTIAHTPARISWMCTCGADGAVQYETVLRAQIDYNGHQQTMSEQEGARSCVFCTAVATTDWGTLAGDGSFICKECDRVAARSNGGK